MELSPVALRNECAQLFAKVWAGHHVPTLAADRGSPVDPTTSHRMTGRPEGIQQEFTPGLHTRSATETSQSYVGLVNQLSTLHRNAALFPLALGGFAIGVTEFATMGVLPIIVEDLLPGFALYPAQEISRAGILITLYALGVVVGAPIITALAAKASQTTVALWLLAAFVVGSLASTLAPTFETLAIARFLAALPHATYFGAAALLAGRLMGPGRQGTGIAIAMAGLPIANIIGVPIATWLGQVGGWRWAFGLVTVLFAITFVLVLLFLPRFPGDPSRGVRNSLGGLANGRVWIMVAIGAIGYAGFFAVFAYIAEVVTRITGLAEGAVPWVLAAIGVGMTLGNFAGGWAQDRFGPRILPPGFIAIIASLLLYVVTASTPVGLFISVFLTGFSAFLVIPALQSRFIRMAREAQLMGAAVSHVAFNISNALGAWIGGVVIAAGFGYLSPGWVGALLGVVGLAFGVMSLQVTRQDRLRGADTTGIPVPVSQ